jgi:hypothetical protein
LHSPRLLSATDRGQDAVTLESQFADIAENRPELLPIPGREISQTKIAARTVLIGPSPKVPADMKARTDVEGEALPQVGE